MTLSSARIAAVTTSPTASSLSTSMRPRFKLARLQTTKSPGFVVVTTTVSPPCVSMVRLTRSMGAMFCAISVQRFEQ